jgi:hypothetical protein
MGTYMKLVTKYHIPVSNSCLEKCDEKCAYTKVCFKMCIKINKIDKQVVGIWWVQKRFPRYGVPIWSLWPYIRFLPSIVAEKNTTKNVHICSMCMKNNEVGKQEVEIWRVQKRFSQYGIPNGYMKLVTKYHIPVINSCLEKCDEKCAYTNVCFKMCIKINKIGKQEVGIWWVQKHFPQYEVPIWSL